MDHERKARRAVSAAMLVLATLVVAPTASADETDPRWRGAVAAGTEFPMSFGLRGQVEAPFRLRLSTTLGVMPGPYVGTINAFLVGINAYDRATADLIRAALSSSLMWRTHLGYRPFRLHGFTVEAGYGLVALGGGASAATLITAMTGQEAPDSAENKNYKVGSVLHMLDVELGWEWEIVKHFFVRAALGGAFTVGSSTTIEPDFQPKAPRLTAAFASAGETYLDTTYTTYVFTPVVSLWAGYAF
jgi:hypothetical protein